nr:uncharacterized protein LOC129385499 [Dermacentor andersoni]
MPVGNGSWSASTISGAQATYHRVGEQQWPASLVSDACKVLERVALVRLEWISAQLQFFPEQESGFRRYRYTADSIADVVPTLEDAKSCGDMFMLLLLDAASAFDDLPHTVVEAAMDGLGINGCLRSFVTGFLKGRTFQVRVGRELSEPRDITAGIPQGSVLSPLLFNMELAGLPASLPAATRFPTRCSIYAVDVALWVRRPRRSTPAIRRSLQEALDAVVSYLGSIGLRVSATKTEALLIHRLASARLQLKQLKAGAKALPWKPVVTYLGLTIDHRLTWIRAAKAATTKARRVQGAISKLQQHGCGCTTKWALRLNQAAAPSALLYALPLVNLSPARKCQLKALHRGARTLGHLDLLHRTPDGRALLERLRSLPSSWIGGLCLLCEQIITHPPVAIVSPPPHHRPSEVHLSLGGATKHRTPAAALQQAASCKLQEQLEGWLQEFTDGSVMPDGSAAATCVINARAISRQCRLPFPMSSTAAELVGLRLAAALLAGDPPARPVAVLCVSKQALQSLSNCHRAGMTGTLLAAKFSALASSGVSVSFHWLPSHVDIAGNEEADTLAKAAHHAGATLTRAVAPSDYWRPRLKKLLRTIHPGPRVAKGKGPKLLPESGLTRRDRATLLRLRTGCTWTAARRHAIGRRVSPSCRRCGDPETLEHLICA